jgi:hypothetical protein
VAEPRGAYAVPCEVVGLVLVDLPPEAIMPLDDLNADDECRYGLARYALTLDDKVWADGSVCSVLLCAEHTARARALGGVTAVQSFASGEVQP